MWALQAMTASRPRAHYVVTPKRLEYWILPRLLPALGLARRVDAQICCEGAIAHDRLWCCCCAACVCMWSS